MFLKWDKMGTIVYAFKSHLLRRLRLKGYWSPGVQGQHGQHSEASV